MYIFKKILVENFLFYFKFLCKILFSKKFLPKYFYSKYVDKVFFNFFFGLVGCSWLGPGGLVVAGWMQEGTTGKSVSA